MCSSPDQPRGPSLSAPGHPVPSGSHSEGWASCSAPLDLISWLPKLLAQSSLASWPFPACTCLFCHFFFLFQPRQCPALILCPGLCTRPSHSQHGALFGEAFRPIAHSPLLWLTLCNALSPLSPSASPCFLQLAFREPLCVPGTYKGKMKPSSAIGEPQSNMDGFQRSFLSHKMGIILLNYFTGVL